MCIATTANIDSIFRISKYTNLLFLSVSCNLFSSNISIHSIFQNYFFQVVFVQMHLLNFVFQLQNSLV